MIKFYYRRALLFGASLFVVLNAQSQATNGVATNNTYNPAWYLGWNAFSDANPLLFKTTGLNRMKLNGIVNYTVNGYNSNRDGYLLIGFPGNSMQTGLPIYTSTGAYSMLHLNGRSVDVQEYGHKWYFVPAARRKIVRELYLTKHSIKFQIKRQ